MTKQQGSRQGVLVHAVDYMLFNCPIIAGYIHIVASELKDPIWHSSEWQIGSFSSEATI